LGSIDERLGPLAGRPLLMSGLPALGGAGSRLPWLATRLDPLPPIDGRGRGKREVFPACDGGSTVAVEALRMHEWGRSTSSVAGMLSARSGELASSSRGAHATS
jgi:hypothetical protein